MRIVMIMTMFFGLALGGQTKDIPLGDKDFYPTPERPIGFRGDNNGYFPGAKIVTEFYEAPPVESEMSYIHSSGKPSKGKFIDLGDGPSKNIVWKTKLPSWGNTQPIVVGDKVFTLAEPDMMVCLSAKSGKILWVDSVNPWEIEALERFGGELSAEQKKAVELARDLYDVWLTVDALLAFSPDIGGGCGRKVAYEEFMGVFNPFAEKELPAIVKRLNELDPDGGYDSEAKKMVAGVEVNENQRIYRDVVENQFSQIFRRIQDLSHEVLVEGTKTTPVFFNKIIAFNAEHDKLAAALKSALDTLKQNEAANAPLQVSNLIARFEKKEYNELRKEINVIPDLNASDEVKSVKTTLTNFMDINSDGRIRADILPMMLAVFSDAVKFAAFTDTELPALYKHLNDMGKPVSQQIKDQISLVMSLIKQGKINIENPRLRSGDPSALRWRIQERIRNISNTDRNSEIPLEIPWKHLVGFNMSVPVSDGKYIYASFGQGMTVCWDFNGNRIWTRFFHPGRGSLRHVHHVLSPMLVKNIIVDMHDHGKILRGLDTATGKIVWEAPAKGASALDGGGYYCSGHKVMKLDGDYYLITALCSIIRMSDGKAVGEIPYKHKPSGGPYITGVDDIIIIGANGDNYNAPMTSFRLKVQPDGTVSAEQLIEYGASEYQTHVHTGEILITQHRKTNIMNVNTGEIYVKDHQPRIGYMSKILAGNTLVWLASNNREAFDSSSSVHGQHWDNRRSDGKVTARFSTADLSNPKNPKMLNEHNILGGVEEPPVPHLEKWIPVSIQNKNFWNGSGGKPAHFAWSDTVLFPQGNRLFLRSVGYMYCIGDPSEEWHTPASAPPEARTAD